MAVNKDSGELVWKTVIDPTPNAIITNSPVVFNGRVYVGTSTSEESWGADTWILSCLVSNPSSLPCPDPAGVDSGPNLFTVNKNGEEIDYVGAGQKSGVYWALNPDDGSVRWATLVGSGSFLGGIQWGSAVEGNRIYCAVVNANHVTVKLAPDGTQTTNGGLWAALDAATGKILWEIPASGEQPFQPGLVAEAFGQVTAANGVVYAASFAGDMVAIEGTRGKILWHFSSGVSVICGPSVVNGTLYWGTGYKRGRGIGGNTVYAFSLP
jgi:polyvinyl alcohol dehydrogenase (cytochrome)